MSTSLTLGADKVTLSSNLELVRPSPGDIPDTSDYSYTSTQLTNGTGAGAANTLYKLTTTLSASATTQINLESLTDDFGNAINFANIKRIYIALTTDTTSTSVLVGAAGVATPAAPTLSQTGSGGSLSDGTYYVSYTLTNGTGETLASTPTTIVVNGGGSSQKITLASITLPSGATGRKIYCSLLSTAHAQAYQGTGSAGAAYDITTLPSTNAVAIPAANTTLIGLKNIFNTQAAAVRVLNGTCFFLGTSAAAAGWAQVASNKYLQITNEDNSNVATLNISAGGDGV